MGARVDELCEALTARVGQSYQRGLTVLKVLAGLLALPAIGAVAILAFGGPVAPITIPLVIIGGLDLLFWIILGGSWLWSQWQTRQIKAFICSDRPLVRWIYTAEEWQALREEHWTEEKDDWKPQFGCLTLLFGLVGLLTGLMVGLDEGLTEEALICIVTGAALGALSGALIGAVVALGNHLAARQAYTQDEPEWTALGPHEVYANGAYFRGDGINRYIQEAHLEPGEPPRLELKIWSPKIRGIPQEEWSVAVPPRLVDEVARVLPDLCLLANEDI